MALEREFVQTSTQTITVDPLSTATTYGAPTFSTSAQQTLTAYIEPGTRVIVTPKGVEEVATASIIVMSSSATIGGNDRITLFDGRIPRILRVDTLNDEQGQHHLEVFVQ